MEIASLASGSSGNCFYIENKGSAILVDAGISTKRIFKGLFDIKRSPDNLKAIFITHEHSDHIKGADVLARKLNIPIFATKKTIENSTICSRPELINPIKNNEVIDLYGMKIEAFSKSHKAADPVSFSISNTHKISIITDAGYACENIISNISDSNALFIESNYDDDMLEKGSYPYFLKKWIKSDIGHLSNIQSALSVKENASSKLKYLILSHLSKNNNTPDIALSTYKIIKENHKLSPITLVSPRETVTPLIKL
ncbi:MAG: MBL fold metallo-hydrolase [Candidatus Pacearchaeota archaeon]|jgi:phosphoribosyl 1,2-cyclic phosphodiesterase